VAPAMSALVEDEQVCWICFGGGAVIDDCGRSADVATCDAAGGSPLERLCGCSQRLSHRQCLARWQLHSAGSPEVRGRALRSLAYPATSALRVRRDSHNACSMRPPP
jgi:hypothetical protein